VQSFQGNKPLLYLLLPGKNQENKCHAEGKVQMPEKSLGVDQLWTKIQL
jgi:hypothetical protein